MARISTTRTGMGIVSFVCAADIGYSHATGGAPVLPALEYVVGLAPAVYGGMKHGSILGLEAGLVGGALGVGADVYQEHGHVHAENLRRNAKRYGVSGAVGGFIAGAVKGAALHGWPAVVGYGVGYGAGSIVTRVVL